MKTKIQIVQFEDGRYAVRKHTPPNLWVLRLKPVYEFSNNDGRWYKLTYAAKYCTYETAEKAKEILDIHTDIGEPICKLQLKLKKSED